MKYGSVVGLVLAALAAAALGQATQPQLATGDSKVKMQAEATAAYTRIVKYFLHSNWEDLKKELRDSPKYNTSFTPAQSADMVYIRKAFTDLRPEWWKNCHSSSNVTFTANIWGKNFTANYMPSETLGMQAPVDIYQGKIRVVVSWRPNFVDSRKALKGGLATEHGLTEGDLGEVIVWHELGHNYITNFLPLQQVLELYNDYLMLFDHLQEFYADMTSLYHCSTQGRLACLGLRLPSLEDARESEEHYRASYGIGSLLLANILSDPSKWPSVHLPPKVPEEDVERNTIIYVYENLDKNWTLAEDKALRDLVSRFIRTNGEGVLRNKGKIPLPNKLEFWLMSGDDHTMLEKRDKWVAEQLTKAIKDGRADKPAATKPTRGPFMEKRIEIPW